MSALPIPGTSHRAAPPAARRGALPGIGPDPAGGGLVEDGPSGGGPGVTAPSDDAVSGRDRGHGARDRGASPVELAILMPAILVLLFLSVQIATIFIAGSVALSAAQEAVTAQRAYQAPPGSGAERANAFLANTGDWLGDPEIVDETGGSTTHVVFTVRGEALSVIPGLTFPVSKTAYGTVERFTWEGE